MKKLLSVITAAAIGLSAGIVIAGSTPGSGIYNTPHDLVNYNGPYKTGDVQDRICAFCHSPHHAYTQADFPMADYLPLWSHGVETQSPSPYSSASFDQYGGKTASPDALIGDSRLCMSCHDGNIAVDAYYGSAGSKYITNTGTNWMTWSQIELNMQKTHPIGFPLTDVWAGGKNADPNIIATKSSPYQGNLNAVTVGQRLYYLGSDGFMTCSTCHDVHNKLNDTSTSIKAGTQTFFLLGGQKNSAICITCHNQAGTGVPVYY